MRKLVIVLLLIAFCVVPCGCQKEQPASIAIVPLDSRPCNTQYAVLLGEMAGYEVLIPNEALLDQFTQPSDAEQLWDWLDETESDHYILFTNQLMNGGLINSRSLASYQDEALFFSQLDRFLEQHKDSTVTMISVLPRLLPSQYDVELWQYQKELSAYGSAVDFALQNKDALPTPPKTVPKAWVDQYLALYQTNYEMLLKLSAYAKENVSLVIGQDDAQQYCPSNIIYRVMQEQQCENVTLLHGADELTMLTVAKYNANPTSLRIIYSDETEKHSYYPYEGVDLLTALEEKAAYVNITFDESAKDTLIIHTNPSSLTETKRLLDDSYEGYVALADIAYTNKGDIGLTKLLFTEELFQKIHCYSGWNTASNTLGTVLAHYQISQNYADNKTAEKAALAFKLTRYSEDQVYQGHISNLLRGELMQTKHMDTTTAFVDESSYEIAMEKLNSMFDPYGAKLQTLATGTQEILPGIRFDCKKASYTVRFPWTRAFEIYAGWEVFLGK